MGWASDPAGCALKHVEKVDLFRKWLTLGKDSAEARSQTNPPGLANRRPSNRTVYFCWAAWDSQPQNLDRLSCAVLFAGPVAGLV